VAEALAGLFEQATARLIGRPVGAQDRIGLAVSGGADSMAMLDLARICWPGQIAAATVDHGLRPEARDEAAVVASWCAEQGIPHRTLSPGEPIAGNLQARARQARYGLLRDWQTALGLHWLLTAHQADDQLETLIMRLNRGSGVGGLACVRARQDDLLRPLLTIRRAQLRSWCIDHGVPFVDDPSNADPHYDRARLRRALDGLDLIDPARLDRSLEVLAEADAALDWMAREVIAAHVRGEAGQLRLSRTDFPRAVLRRVLLRMIAMVNDDAPPPRGPSVDQALVQLFAGKSVSLSDCVATGGATWTVGRAPPRRPGRSITGL
jgi:tRNA(Ile)-lysidine synthase